MYTIKIFPKRILKLLLFSCMIVFGNSTSSEANSWMQKANFIGIVRTASVSFSVLGKGYVGTGQDSSGTLLNDFWEYDPSLDTWTQLADFAGSPRTGACGFGIDSSGYIGLGHDGVTYQKDLWKYLPQTNSWIQVQDLGYNRGGTINGRRDVAVTVASGKAYIICGYEGNTTYGKQCWQFDPLADTSWALRRNFTNATDFSFIGRRWGIAFTISPHIYFGTGYDYTHNYKKDFWRYNTSTDSWAQVADLPGQTRANACGFSLQDEGYIVCGTNLTQQFDLWRFNSILNNWTKLSDYPGYATSNNINFVINNHAYVGMGSDSLDAYQNDFWEFSPDSLTSVGDIEHNPEIIIFPNPTKDYFKINFAGLYSTNSWQFKLYGIDGQVHLNEQIRDKETIISRSNLASGIYFISISENNRIVYSGRILLE